MSDQLIHTAGWVFLHFLWQGAVVAGVLALTLVCLRGSDARIRYGASLLALLAMFVAPLVTFSVLWSGGETASLTGMSLGEAEALLSLIAEGSATGPLDRAAPFLAVFWGIGSILVQLRTCVLWLRAVRLRVTATKPISQRWQTITQEMCSLMGIRSSVRVLESREATVPAVIGWLSPVVLVPAAALASLSTAELRSVLAHELAHVRRHDYLVNLAQAFLESLLFFHPAVWWVSGRVREEREYCCDDVAVRLCGDPVCHAKALARLEAMRSGELLLAPASNGGSLMDRIQRLIGTKSSTRRTRAAGPAAAAVLVAGFLSTTAFGLGATAEPATSPQDPARERSVAEIEARIADLKAQIQDVRAKIEDLRRAQRSDRLPGAVRERVGEHPGVHSGGHGGDHRGHGEHHFPLPDNQHQSRGHALPTLDLLFQERDDDGDVRRHLFGGQGGDVDPWSQRLPKRLDLWLERSSGGAHDPRNNQRFGQLEHLPQLIIERLHGDARFDGLHEEITKKVHEALREHGLAVDFLKEAQGKRFEAQDVVEQLKRHLHGSGHEPLETQRRFNVPFPVEEFKNAQHHDALLKRAHEALIEAQKGQGAHKDLLFQVREAFKDVDFPEREELHEHLLQKAHEALSGADFSSNQQVHKELIEKVHEALRSAEVKATMNADVLKHVQEALDNADIQNLEIGVDEDTLRRLLDRAREHTEYIEYFDQAQIDHLLRGAHETIEQLQKSGHEGHLEKLVQNVHEHLDRLREEEAVDAFFQGEHGQHSDAHGVHEAHAEHATQDYFFADPHDVHDSHDMHGHDTGSELR